MRNFRLRTHASMCIALDEVRRCIHTCRSSQESDPLYICCEKSLQPWIGTYISRCMRSRKSVGRVYIFVPRKLYLWHNYNRVVYE